MIENFRDLGGHSASAGRRLRTGVLFRSGDYRDATAEELLALSQHGINVILDLRTPAERGADGARYWPSFSGRVITSDIPEPVSDWATFFQTEAPIGKAAFERRSMQFYKEAFRQLRYISLFRRYLEACAAPDSIVLAHCSAGKDRTGVLCALVGKIAGVHMDDLLQDYLLSNQPALVASRSLRFGHWLYEQFGVVVDEETLRHAVSVQPTFLHAFFEGIELHCGSLSIYLTEVLGIMDKMTSDIRTRIVI